jgi:hypothetical protein
MYEFLGYGYGYGYPRQPKYSGVQPIMYPTTDFLKRLILLYSFEIKLNTCRNNRNFISIYFKAKCQSKLLDFGLIFLISIREFIKYICKILNIFDFDLKYYYEIKTLF